MTMPGRGAEIRIVCLNLSGDRQSSLARGIFRNLAPEPRRVSRYEGGLAASHLTDEAAGNFAAAFADRLRAAGIAQGERILFWSENRPEWVVALWGCLLEGVIAVPLDFRSSATVVERIAAIVSARALLIGEALRRRPAACLPSLADPRCRLPTLRGRPSVSTRPARQYRRDSLHLRRHRRSQRRHPHASQHPRQSETDRRGHRKIS